MLLLCRRHCRRRWELVGMFDFATRRYLKMRKTRKRRPCGKLQESMLRSLSAAGSELDLQWGSAPRHQSAR